MFRKMPFIVMMVIIVVFCLDPFLTLSSKQILFALSLSIKALIIFTLPLIIFGLLFKTMINLANRASAVIGIILLCVCCSNFVSTFFSHYMGSWIYLFNLNIALPKTTQGLQAAWTFNLPTIIGNDIAMFLAIFAGILAGFFMPQQGKPWADKLNNLVNQILRCITLIIPLFVAGFIVKLQADGILQTIIKDYSAIFLLIASTQLVYIFCAYLFVNKFKLAATLTSIKNMLPAAIAGFSTMSSAAAMPLTIAAAETNAKNKSLAGSVIPATVNIHLMGDCIAIPILAYAVMKSFGIAEPALYSYLIFVFYFVLAKFSVAAIPGGGIIVMLPILENYLGFNAEMLSLITALYILFDPVITCANVMGNGAFAQLIDQVMLVFRSGKVAVEKEYLPLQ